MTKKQPNLKLYIGIQYTVIKQAIDYEDNDPDDVNMRQVGEPKHECKNKAAECI